MKPNRKPWNNFILKLMDLLAAIPVPARIRKQHYQQNLSLFRNLVPGNRSAATSAAVRAATGAAPAVRMPDNAPASGNITANDKDAAPFRDQHNPLWQHARFGGFSMQYNGCGEIAVLNLLHFTGKAVTPEEDAAVIASLEQHGAVLQGLFGTSPLSLVRCLAVHKVSGKVCSAPDEKTLHALWEQYDLFLVTAWNDPKRPWKGMHTFAARKTEGHRKDQLITWNASFTQWPAGVVLAAGFVTSASET